MNEDNPAALDTLRDPRSAAILVSLAEERGLDAAVCLAGSGLRRADLFGTLQPIAAVQELTVVRNVVHALGDPVGLACQAGGRVRFGMLGSWGHAVRTAATPEDAFRIAIDYGYGRFSWAMSRPRLVATAPEVRIAFDGDHLPPDLRDFLVTRDMVFTVLLLPEIFGSTVPVRLELAANAEPNDPLSRAVAPHPVLFGRERDMLVFDRSILSVRMRHSDPDAMVTLEQEWAGPAGSRPHAGGGSEVAALVRALVLRDPGAPISLTDVAAERHVDPRTLRRQLAAEGTSFREVVDAARTEVAVELLVVAGLPIQAVAHRLGFTDANNFIRAFKRWTGQTPAAYREAHSD